MLHNFLEPPVPLPDHPHGENVHPRGQSECFYVPASHILMIYSWKVPGFVFLLFSSSIGRLLLGPPQANSPLGWKSPVPSASPHRAGAPAFDQLCGLGDLLGSPVWTLHLIPWALSWRRKSPPLIYQLFGSAVRSWHYLKLLVFFLQFSEETSLVTQVAKASSRLCMPLLQDSLRAGSSLLVLMQCFLCLLPSKSIFGWNIEIGIIPFGWAVCHTNRWL